MNDACCRRCEMIKKAEGFFGLLPVQGKTLCGDSTLSDEIKHGTLGEDEKHCSCSERLYTGCVKRYTETGKSASAYPAHRFSMSFRPFRHAVRGASDCCYGDVSKRLLPGAVRHSLTCRFYGCCIRGTASGSSKPLYVLRGSMAQYGRPASPRW